MWYNFNPDQIPVSNRASSDGTTMGSPSPSNSESSEPTADGQNAELAALVDRIVGGDRAALAQMFTIYRPRLWRMVNFRLHPKLRGRVDPDDVLQDAWLRAVDRIKHFFADATRSSFVWFRIVVSQTLVEVHRRHLGADKRSVERELSIHGRWNSESTSSSLAYHLKDNLASPSSVFGRAELAGQVDAVIQNMDPVDREVLALRHFEHLSNSETAMVLDMSEQAASARYVRALQKLRRILEVMPGLAHDQNGRA